MSLWNPSTWFNSPAPLAPSNPNDSFDASGSAGGFHAPFETNNFLTESYEQAPESEGLFSKWWSGATDAFGQATESASETFESVGEMAAEFGNDVSVQFGAAAEAVADSFETTWDGLQTSFEEGANQVREGFDVMASAIDDSVAAGADWLGERAETLQGEIAEARDATVVAFDEFTERAETAANVASALGEAYVGQEVDQARLLFEGAQTVWSTSLDAAATVARTGMEVQRAAIDAGLVTWDVNLEDGAFREDMLDHGIERIGAGLDASGGGELLSTAMDFAVWSAQIGEGMDYLVAGEGREPEADEQGWISRELNRVTGDSAELRDFALSGPVAYYSDEAVQALERQLAVGAEMLIDGARGVATASWQMPTEYAGHMMGGADPDDALALTLVGDDDFVSEAEIEANRSRPLGPWAPDYSARARLLDTVGDPNDPNRALFINGILNDEERASLIAEEVRLHFGVNITPVYNPTRNAMYDIAQTQLVNKLDRVDESTALLVDTIRERLADPSRTEPLKLFPHSQGAALTSSALSHLTLAERSQIEVESFGGAAYTYPPGLRSLKAVVNVQDLVPSGVGAGVPGLDRSSFYDRPEYTVQYVDFGTAGKFEDSHNVFGYLRELEGGRVFGARWQATFARSLRVEDETGRR